MSRVRTYALELEVEIEEDTPDGLVEAMLPRVVRYSSATEAIDTGLFGADDHLHANVLTLRYVGPLTSPRETP